MRAVTLYRMDLNPNLTHMLNKVEGGNYHGFNNDHYHHPVDHRVRRRRRLLLDKTTVGLTQNRSHTAYDIHPKWIILAGVGIIVGIAHY